MEAKHYGVSNKLINSTWNGEELSEKWKESIVVFDDCVPYGLVDKQSEWST